MRKIILLLSICLATSFAYSQAIFKGLDYGMSTKEAKKEFKTHKEKYNNIDFGNGFTWRIFGHSFIYNNGHLTGVLFSPKGALMGLSHDGAISYLEYSRAFFERKGYTVFLEPESWQYPINFRSKYGLLMHDEEKSIVVQLYPYKGYANGKMLYSAYMKVLNYEWFMNDYRKQNQILEEKSKNSGF